MLDARFTELLDSLPASLEALMAMPPTAVSSLPPVARMPKSGVYLWSEGDAHIYVGRSRRIRQRLQEHCRPSSGHNQASFAFLLAREMTGNTVATYATKGSRDELLTDPAFRRAFENAKARLRDMQLRFVAEPHPVRQCILEVYVATVLQARYNDFDSH